MPHRSGSFCLNQVVISRFLNGGYVLRCEKCGKVYCEECGKEWGENVITYWYSYPNGISVNDPSLIGNDIKTTMTWSS